jgi:Flp pilus assembly protein TadG
MSSSWLGRLRRVLADRRGAVSPIMTLMLVPLIGALGVAAESSGWFLIQRAAQTAADAAVMAAASNDSTTAPSYDQEAKGVAASHGFTDTVNNTTVTVVNNATCPSPSTLTNCYQVTIQRKVPIALATIVGYSGNTTVSGQPAVLVSATALASKPLPAMDCLITNTSFTTHGAPNFDAGGCTLYSNGTTTCDGGDLTALGFGAGFAIGTDKKCNVTAVATSATDPYASTLANNPPTGCHDYGSSPPTGGGTLDWSGYPCVTIGVDWTISAATKILTDTSSANKGTVLVMKNNANIILNSTLQADFGQALSIVFTGASGAPGFISGGSGTIDFGAPTSGPWSGAALYQDPSLGASSVTYSGNKPTFNITGMIYAPKAAMTYSGAINHETGGYACIAFIVDSLLINGTGSIFDNPTSQCYQAGLSGLPTAPNTVAVRQALVQ